MLGFLYTYVLKPALTLALVLPPLALSLLYYFQNDIIYPARFPPGSRERVDTPASVGFARDAWEEVWIDVGKDRLQAFVIYARPGAVTVGETAETAETVGEPAETIPENKHEAGTIVYCHANAGNMGHRLPIAKILHGALKCNIVMFSYRGYGITPGKACESSMTLDAQAVLDWVLEHETLRGKVVLFGQSIGGAVAIKTAGQARNYGKVDGVIVENTFLSLRKLVPHVMPVMSMLRAEGLVSDEWKSEEWIQRIPISVAMCFLSGGIDEVVPAEHMEQLYSKGRNRDEGGVRARVQMSWMFTFPEGRHNDTVGQEGFFERIELFWRVMIIRTSAEPEIIFDV